MCTSAILWCKPNLIVVDVVFIAIIGIQLLINKKFKELINCVIYYIIGLLIVTLPIVIYLIANNALKHCINSYILFNIRYVGDNGGFLSTLLCAIDYWSLTILSSISFIICIIGAIKNYKKEGYYFITLLANAAFIILSFYIVSMSGRNHPYYAIICTPTFVYPIAYALNYLLKDKKQNLLTFLIIICTILIAFCNETNDTINLVLKAHNSKNNPAEKIAAEYVKNKTTENDEVIILGNKTVINLLANRTNSSKYFFQNPIANIDKKIAKEFLKWLKKDKPQVMILIVDDLKNQKTYFKKELYNYLNMVTQKGEYTINKEVVKNYIIYEKVK